MYSDAAAQKQENLNRVCLTIKKRVNELLSNHDDVDYLENPSVAVDVIAKEVGIADIKFVPPEEIYHFHAILDNSDKNNVIIKVNKKDPQDEQLFSIAHEIEHYLEKKADMLKMADVFKNTDASRKDEVFKKAYVFVETDELVARYSVSNYKEAKKMIKKIKGSESVACYMTETVSEKLGKDVPKEQAYKELAKILLAYSIRANIALNDSSISQNDSSKQFMQNMIYMLLRRKSVEHFMLNMINRLYDEEIADYFAANLLVPTERFIAWENKSNGKIAKKFGVSKACIKKRRKEIKHELELLTATNISSGDKK